MSTTIEQLQNFPQVATWGEELTFISRATWSLFGVLFWDTAARVIALDSK